MLNGLRIFKGHNPLPPMFVELLLTYRCNMSCTFCYQDREKRKDFPDLSLEDAMAIEENLRNSFKFKPRIHLFGGEPTVNEDFFGILKLFSEKGYKISITTNGLELDKYLRDLTLLKNLIEINLSLNSLDCGKHLSIINDLKNNRRKTRIRINLNCPINLSNQDYLMDIVKRFENTGLDCIIFQHTTFTRNYKREIDFNSIKDQIIAMKRNGRIPVLFNPDIKLNDIKNYYSNDVSFPCNNRCIFSWFVLFIQPNANIIPCDEVDFVIDNAKIRSLKDIWNSTNFRKFRHNIIKYGVTYPICNRCCHRQYY